MPRKKCRALSAPVQNLLFPLRSSRGSTCARVPLSSETNECQSQLLSASLRRIFYDGRPDQTFIPRLLVRKQ
eukprot:8864046-Pyramimonas_sp.AAC.1